jgi:hypothetical protein
MGVVYKARQLRLNRLVALKLVRADAAVTAAHCPRFLVEGEVLARLQHPHVVQIYDIGFHRGQAYFALELVAGGSLAQKLQGKPLPGRAAAELVACLAGAVQAAHAQRVVHRDLKPANVLLTADGVPKLTDFGLAKMADVDLRLTRTGEVFGTPAYMAPEQALGQAAQVGPLTDVYALGAILYESLTGRPPFVAATYQEVVQQVSGHEPVPPGRLQPGIPQDLQTITLTCLQKEPRRRYASARELADDLHRFLAQEPIRARPPSALYHLRQFARRHTGLVGGVLATGAALVLGLVGTILFAVAEARQRGQAEYNAQQALDEKREAQRQAYRARLAAAVAALSAHDVANAARQLDAAPEELRDWEWRHLHSRLDDSSAVFPLPVRGLGFLLAAPDGLRAAACTPDGIRVTDLERGESKTLPIDPERGRSFSVAQTRRGIRVVVWIRDSTFDLLDEAGELLCHVEAPLGTGPGPVVMCPDATRLACNQFDGEWERLAMFDAASGKQTAVCAGHCKVIWAYTFSPDGTRFASAGEDNTARLWDPATGALLATCQGHTSRVLSVAFRPDGARLVTTSSDGTVRQWDAGTGREVEAPYDRHSGEVAAAVYSPDGQWVQSGRAVGRLGGHRPNRPGVAGEGPAGHGGPARPHGGRDRGGVRPGRPPAGLPQRPLGAPLVGGGRHGAGLGK